MELQCNKSRFGYDKQALGVPVRSKDNSFLVTSSKKALLLDHAAHQCQILPSPSKSCTKIRHGKLSLIFHDYPNQEFTLSSDKYEVFADVILGYECRKMNSVITKMVKLGARMDILAQGIREHVRLGPKLTETVKGKLRLGATILRVGGVEKVFEKTFNIIRDGEKLLYACQCYLSTTEGPIAGLAFVSSDRVCFCSERSIKITSPTGKPLKLHYKVMIPLRKIKRAVESENVKKPRQKYVDIVTEDGFDFWFMGVLNHQRLLTHLQQAIHQPIINCWATQLL